MDNRPNHRNHTSKGKKKNRSKSPRPTTVVVSSNPELTSENEVEKKMKDDLLKVVFKPEEKKATTPPPAAAVISPGNRSFKELLPDTPVKKNSKHANEQVKANLTTEFAQPQEPESQAPFTENPSKNTYKLTLQIYSKIKNFNSLTSKICNFSESIANKSIDIVGKFVTLPTSIYDPNNKNSTNLETLSEGVILPLLTKTDVIISPIVGTSATVLKVGPVVYEKTKPLINVLNKIFPKEVALKIGKWLGDMIMGSVLFLEKRKGEVRRQKAEEEAKASSA